LVAEELTEDRALNITAIKQVTDVSSIKARYVHKDNFTFTASHSLFVTTNYIPVVNETDHGTWRRLVLLVFPFTFRKPGEPLTGAKDRRGDPTLKGRIRGGVDGQHDAIVTWAIEGAKIWYETGFPALPAIVATHTHAWRKQADRILGFWDEQLVAEPDSCILSTDLLLVFNDWLRTNGHHEWSKELFHPRFKSHVETIRHHVEERREKSPKGLDRPTRAFLTDVPTQPQIYRGVRFRTPDEINENIEENSDVADVADPKANSPIEVELKKFPKGSARSATCYKNNTSDQCCEGGPPQLKCRLCPASESYWRESVPTDDHDPREGDRGRL
jgi:phage/plasmid-associated DNA primase